MSTTTTEPQRAAPSSRRLHTIGAVCARLQPEFPDISISKIRYLEDQGLLTPKRTRGGYRLFSEEDVERLETILRLQRDEFLPLRVIRQELATRRGRRPQAKPARPASASTRARSTSRELCERAGIDVDLARALEEYGLLTPRIEGGRAALPRGRRRHRGRVRAGSPSTGSTPGTCAPSATRPDARPGLLEQLVAPALRSRNPERRKAGLDDLQALAETSQELSRSSSGGSCGSWPRGRVGR